MRPFSGVGAEALGSEDLLSLHGVAEVFDDFSSENLLVASELRLDGANGAGGLMSRGWQPDSEK
jgi:hypothetical protein